MRRDEPRLHNGTEKEKRKKIKLTMMSKSVRMGSTMTMSGSGLLRRMNTNTDYSGCCYGSFSFFEFLTIFAFCMLRKKFCFIKD